MNESAGHTRRTISEAAAERNRLHGEMRGHARGEAPPALLAAYEESRRFIDRATSAEALDALRAGDPEALEYAVCFMEEHPFCPDSGFALRDLSRALKTAGLPASVKTRLRAALLAIASRPARDEMKHLRQLALAVADEDFVRSLDDLAESGDAAAQANAAALATYITKHWDAPPWANRNGE